MTEETAESPEKRFAPGRGTRLLLIALPTVLVVALLCGIGEIVVRYRERHRTTVPGSMPALYYRHVTLGHALVRGYDYYGWAHTNAQGFRGARPVTTEKPSGTTRIMAVGGYRFLAQDLQEWAKRLGQGAMLTALPDRMSGYRLAGRAQDNARARDALSELGLNPLMVEAFRDRASAL